MESGPRLAEREDEDVSTELREALAAEGVAVRCGAEAARAEPTSGGVRLHVEGGEPLDATHLFVATGRQADRGGLGRDSVGLKPGKRGEIAVDAASAPPSPASSLPKTSAAAASSPTPPKTTSACWGASC